MPDHHWVAVDDYFCKLFVPTDPVMDEVVRVSDERGLPQHHVAPNQGKLLNLLAQLQGARRILEIGTLGGYSTIWLARALPENGHLVTLEYDPQYAEVAVQNLARAGVRDRVRIRVGRALDSLVQLAQEEHGPFDMIFIDADKQNNPDYFTWGLKFSRPGTLIIVDNVVRDGAIIDENSTDPSVVGTRRLADMVASEPRVSATAIQTVGSKGYDGFILIRVL